MTKMTEGKYVHIHLCWILTNPGTGLLILYVTTPKYTCPVCLQHKTEEKCEYSCPVSERSGKFKIVVIIKVTSCWIINSDMVQPEKYD